MNQLALNGAARLSCMGLTALSYLAFGRITIPLCWSDRHGTCACPKRHDQAKAVGKAPLLGYGYDTIRPTALDVRAWWTAWPQANIGILLEPSGLLVIDCDSEAAIREAQVFGLPPSPVVTSGKGLHYYYRAPAEIAGRTTKRGASKGIDILGKGYIVAPPSRHRTGRRYQWLIAPEGWHCPNPRRGR